MDLNKNIIPQNIKKIHLIAICGTGMGALACMLKDLGYEITGSDQNVYPPISDFLYQKQIKIDQGFDEKNLLHSPDLVIIGNTVRKDNPEVVQTDKMNLAYCSMPQALNGIVAKGKKRLLVTGTHGKTTTSSILSWMLYKAGFDPSFMIGGILNNFKSNYRLGKGDYIIIEGDEYDTAFFDKKAKFFHYNPFMAILTSVEFDHADIYKDIDHIVQTFDKFILEFDKNSTLFVFDNDENIQNIINNKRCIIEKYGKKSDSNWKLTNINIESPWNNFEVLKNKKFFGKFKTKMFGEHNLLNALSVVALADKLKIPINVIKQGFETFSGVKRRQEIRGIKNNITVMDDFAHHPTAVKETIKAVKPFYPKSNIIAVFEPRTNSSMRKIFQNIYPNCFDRADIICIREPSMIHKIPADNRFSSKQLTEDLKKQGKKAYYFQNTDDIIEFLVENAQTYDLILVMSNGGFDNIHARLIEAL